MAKARSEGEPSPAPAASEQKSALVRRCARCTHCDASIADLRGVGKALCRKRAPFAQVRPELDYCSEFDAA
jgi:hypothetical protein